MYLSLDCHADSITPQSYVLDGNAMGSTAHEAVHRRQPLSFNTQPDTIVVSIGYPLTSNIYDFVNRFQDYSPPIATPRIPEAHGDEFLEFIDGSLRPFIRESVFPHVKFTRDGIYGHSFGGLLVLYAMVYDRGLFDTYLSASPAVEWRNGSILEMVSEALGGGGGLEGRDIRDSSCNWGGCFGLNETYEKPALLITYGSLEQFPVRRRRETYKEFQFRKDYFRPLRMTDYVHELFDRVVESGKLRDVVLKEYVGQDHSGVAGTSIMDAVEYFLDW